MTVIKSTPVKDVEGSNWTDKALTNTSTTYSLPISFFYSDGYASLLIKTTASITITFEVSVDKQNWYAPYDIDGNLLDAVVTTLSADRWVSFAPQIAGYIRFKVVANAAATTTLTIIEKKKDNKV